MYQINFHAIPNLISSLFCLSIGLISCFRNRRSIVNRIFFFLTFVVFIWQIGTFLVLLSMQPDVALFWCRFVYIGAIFIPIVFYHFTISFLELKQKKFILLNYLLGFFIFLPLSWTPYFIIDVYRYSWGYWFKAGAIHPLFLLYFTFLMGLSLYLLYLKFKKETLPLQKLRERYLILGFLVAYLGAIDYLPDYGIKVYPVGHLSIILSAVILYYAIIKYRLLDITIALTRAGIFALVYFPVIFLPFWIIPKFIHTKLYWFPTLLMGILATLGIFIYNKLRRQAESLIRAEELYSHQLLKKAAEGMIRYRSLKELLNLIVHIVCKILKIENAITFLLDENTGDFNLSAVRFKSQYYYLEKLNRDDALVKRLSLLKQPLVYEEVRLKAQEEKDNPKAPIHEIESQMLKLKASLIVPAISKEKLLGFLVLSEKKSKRAYSAEDISTLWALSYQAALAIENALLYQKEKLFLAEQSRRQALADMAPGAAHQFDNRLFAISSIADSLLAILEEIDLENISLEKIKELIPLTIKKLKQIVDETIKGGQITEAILQKAKVKMEFSPTDIVKVIENTISLAKLRRTPQTLDNLPPPEIIFNHPKDLPLLMLCEGPIQDCIENIIDNACDAYVIKTKRFGEYRGIITITLSKKDNYVIIEIYDNGIGIAPENLNKIFTPYFTTKASSEKGVYGKAGLGMWVVRDFIERHKGQITVESEYTKWTKFTIKLPIDFKSE